MISIWRCTVLSRDLDRLVIGHRTGHQSWIPAWILEQINQNALASTMYNRSYNYDYESSILLWLTASLPRSCKHLPWHVLVSSENFHNREDLLWLNIYQPSPNKTKWKYKQKWKNKKYNHYLLNNQIFIQNLSRFGIVSKTTILKIQEQM